LAYGKRAQLDYDKKLVHGVEHMGIVARTREEGWKTGSEVGQTLLAFGL